MNTVVQTTNLHKHFGRVRALDGLDLEVQRGEIHGFLGPNGAGKSTTLRILLGLARATSGSATVLGVDPWAQAAELHRHLAYVPGDVRLWPNLSGGETIDLLSRLRGGAADEAAYRRRKDRLCQVFDFDPTKKGRAYSKGNRQKVALIAALATEAGLYLLDEPTSGLDPLMEEVFRRELLAAVERGATVLLSSHILSEVEALCHRVSIIRAGRIVDGGTLDSLRHLTRSEVSFAVDGLDPEALARLGAVHGLTVDAGRVRFSADSDRIAEVLPALGALGVQGLTIVPPSLEELFLRHYGDRAAAPSPGTDDPAGAGHGTRRHLLGARGRS
ncbi:ABC-2 type transport system ATP-binding protein [Pseudarthrobacter defluvii]|uniref:ABC transporter ATP-binding protein n=1 Tax=Pseudarthrobacter defluvii TaxID=410837 RepID=UPI00277DD8E5|nr:ABC transporter ATP-binding protein [Pseudarthrobacter defluvii]MDQ0768101.1 ABC-2 type transport system ATP-binding protein [Pseudarthrobacter defluvii]